MKPPEHHFINEYGQREIRHMWLGTGVRDKNDVEIFEGDIVNVIFDSYSELNSRIIYLDGNFWLLATDKSQWQLFNVPLDSIEVVGHIAEEQL